MENILLKKDGLDFCISTEFKSNYLLPIIENLILKAETGWDDYNEVYHCSKLVESIKKDENMQMDFHFIKKAEKYLGVALVTKGLLNYNLFFHQPVAVEEELQSTLIFNFFHISQAARGNGERWLRDIIMEYYKALHFKAIYLKSSHQKVFSMYNRLGFEIGEYTSYSDNKLFERQGKVFKILL